MHPLTSTCPSISASILRALRDSFIKAAVSLPGHGSRLTLPALVLGLAIAAPVSHAADLTRTSIFGYDSATGVLNNEVVEPTASNLCVANQVTGRDAWGNVTTKVTRQCNGQAVGPNAEAAAPTNASEQVDAQTSGSSYTGHTVEESFNSPGTSLSGAVSQYHDALGRKLLTTSVNEHGTIVSGFALMDALGRPVRQYAPFYLDTAAAGVQPRWSGQIPVTAMTYDAMGRVTQVQRAVATGLSAPTQIQTVSTTSYTGLTTTTTQRPTFNSVDDRTTTVTLNATGKPERTVDGLGKELWQFYGPQGDLVKTQAAGIITTVTYDLRGRKVAMTDPDMGSWSYQYDVLGRLKRQTDAKSQQVTMVYDRLNRMTQKTSPDQVSYWQYDVRTNTNCEIDKAVGKLTRAWTQAPGVSTADYDRQICYDDQSRVLSERQRFDPTGIVGKPQLRTTYGYEIGSSRLLTKTMPARPGASPVVLAYQYHASGTLIRVRAQVPAAGASPASTVTVWQPVQRSASGQVIQSALAGDLNGANPSMSRTLTLDSYQRVTKIHTTQAGVFLQRDTLSYNQVDQITSRGWISANNAAENQHLENATYDKVGRITQASIAGGTTTAVTYNDAGDITSKSGVGAYAYAQGTHRLAAIVGSAGGVTNPSYTYDANGNLLTGAGISATWMSFNMVASISRYGNTDRFHYGPDNERIVQESPTTLTLYSLSSGFELEAPYSASNCKKQDMSGCAWEARIYVQAEGKARALLIDRANNTRAWRYMHHDHLGSVTMVTDQAGVVQARYGFDAWGARRNANGTAQTGTIAPEVDRGYTGHEMLDNVGIVHMNGRLYDPQIARMISADPTIPHPDNLQAYSRYAYVYNDPLNKWDPSGYKPKWGRILAAIAFTAIAGPWMSDQIFWALAESGLASTTSVGFVTGVSNVAAGAIVGFTGGLIQSGGDFKSAAHGALSGGLFAGAGLIGAPTSLERYVAHAAAGCVSGALGGGSRGCGQQALAAGAGKFSTNEIGGEPGKFEAKQFVATVIAGGLISKWTGGKFENGVVTAAFGYLFNHALSKAEVAAAYGKHRPKGHHQFPEHMMSDPKYAKYISDEVVDAAGQDARIGAGSVSKGIAGDPHNGRNQRHRDADAALATQMDKWIADGKITEANPMTKKQFYQFLNEAARNPTIGDYWKAIQDFHFQQQRDGKVRGSRGGVRPPIQSGD